ncbi:histidine-phosphotransfer domain, HPT domain-containing protein [Sistotremastrum niveocremeum HHB9708]|uniref:Histidine-phosphotransfer domain, HPT domain-containing protein n=1 Tax=Sistotremastrum niveocremeum HHB9708 TaxID=1314777 RepID=A0A164RGP0_9AGAM|nr:histidine-phosphotransfer domain, HPT domain-containing protein [Sistotremastrum niveocremeum HHB9708]
MIPSGRSRLFPLSSPSSTMSTSPTSERRPSSPRPNSPPTHIPSKPPLIRTASASSALSSRSGQVESRERGQSQPAPPKASARDGEGIVDFDVFDQILELDDDESSFSAEMAQAYFVQADKTFKDMDNAFATKDLKSLSDLGHFLKGSSAALGLSKVQASCETMQNLGKLKDENHEPLKAEEALNRIDDLLVRVKQEYDEAETWLRHFYSQRGAEL